MLAHRTAVSFSLLAGLALLPPSDLLAQDHSAHAMHSSMNRSAPVLVSTEWLAERADHDDLVLLHVAMGRNGLPEEGIAGASFIDYMDVVAGEKDGLRIEFKSVDEMAEAFAAAGVSNDSHVVLYGSPAHLPARLYVALDYLGHGDRTSVLDGDLSVWKAENRAAAAEFAQRDRGDFVADVQDDVLVTLDWMRENFDREGVTLIDARPMDEYTGEDHRDLRPGHIPGAYQLYWPELQESEEHPVLKAMEAVEARFDEAGADDDDVVVSYCFIGMRASYTYLVSKHLGFDARFYDGSWNEWGAQPDTPVKAGADRR